MKYTASTFYYHVKGLSEYFDLFIEKLFNQLALNGTAITDKSAEGDLVRVSVKYKDEKGKLAASPVGGDIKILYEVESGGILRKGVFGALMGGGLASLASSLLAGDVDSIKSALAGAVVGGAYGMLDGFNTATDEATDFSRLLAECIRNVEQELLEMKRQEEEKEREEELEAKSLEDELENVYADAVSVGDEILLLEAEGKDVSKAKARYEIALKNLEEARESLKKGDTLIARAKIRSASRMVELAREELQKL